MNSINETIIKQIKHLMKKHDLLQKQLAVEINIPLTTLNSYLRGHSEFRNDVLLKIAMFFNVSMDYLFGITNDNDLINTKNIIEEYLITNFRNPHDLKIIDNLSKDINKAIKNIKYKEYSHLDNDIENDE